LLKDLKDNNITEEQAHKFIDKFIDKKDLFEFILTLLKKNKLEFLLLNDINEKVDSKKDDSKNDDFKTKGFWDVPEEKPKRKRGKYIKIPNFNKY